MPASLPGEWVLVTVVRLQTPTAAGKPALDCTQTALIVAVLGSLRARLLRSGGTSLEVGFGTRMGLEGIPRQVSEGGHEMPDFTRDYHVTIDAPVDQVFEYCRDPRHLFEGWPQLEVTDVEMTPEGVGTRAHIVGRFAKGAFVEQIEREFTEFVPNEQIVSTAHAKVRFAGRTSEVENGPIFSWRFEPADGGTLLTLGVLEKDLAWWQSALESVSARMMSKNFHGMLAAIKAGVERQGSPAR